MNNVPNKARFGAKGQPVDQGLTTLPPYSFRLPRPGTVDPYFGGARTFWNESCLACEANEFKPPVRSIVVRKKGASRGIRFILFESAKAYFEKLALPQTESPILQSEEP
jgi:hypothetical protein